MLTASALARVADVVLQQNAGLDQKGDYSLLSVKVYMCEFSQVR